MVLNYKIKAYIAATSVTVYQTVSITVLNECTIAVATALTGDTVTYNILDAA